MEHLNLNQADDQDSHAHNYSQPTHKRDNTAQPCAKKPRVSDNIQMNNINHNNTDNHNYTTLPLTSPEQHQHTLDRIWPHPTTQQWLHHKAFNRIYETVRQTAIPNHMGARLSITSGLNIPEWRRMFVDYLDNQIVDSPQFAWLSTAWKTLLSTGTILSGHCAMGAPPRIKRPNTLTVTTKPIWLMTGLRVEG